MRWLLIAWVLGALALTYVRGPYDDEWFSIELAFDTTREQFWRALNQDVHPPFLALLDRAAGSVWSAPMALQGLRVLASALAISLLARALSRSLSLPRWAIWLAACHPIVLFYSGAARWYAFVLLAQALRFLAIWDARPMARAKSFVAGAALGAASGYVDALFLIHDAGWFALRARRAGSSWHAIGALWLAAMSCIPMLRLASPLGAPIHAAGTSWLPHWHWRDILQWAGLGLAGETALPWPFLLSGLACGVACAWALFATLRAPASRALGCFVLSSGAVWLFACGFGVWHPRYSLLFWLLCVALVVYQWQRANRALRVVIALAACHWGVGIALAASGHGFFKADLNALHASDCRQLRAADAGSGVIVPYARLALLAQEQCRLRAPIVRLPSIWMRETEEQQLAGLRAELARHGEYWLLSLNTDSSIAVTQNRVKQLLLAQCSAAGAPAHFGVPPHLELSPQRSPDYRRFSLQRFKC